MRIPNYILNFGENNLSAYKHFADYFRHYSALNIKGKENLEYAKERLIKDENGQEVYAPISFSEKEKEVTEELKAEIFRFAGINPAEMTQLPIEAWSSNPNLQWATFAVVGAMIDMVFPESIIESTGLYAEVRNIGWGDNALFTVKPRDIFAVSRGAYGKRYSELNTQAVAQKAIFPEPRQLSVYTSLMDILTGRDSLAELAVKMARSFETELSYDVYSAFATAMGNITNTASTGLRVAGYSESEFIRLSQTVGAWNSGARPIAIGTQQALAQILPDNANYRYELESDYVRLGFIRNFKGTDLMVIPQLANWKTPFGLKMANDKIWIISPSSQKIVKVVLEGGMLSRSSQPNDNANLLQETSMVKSWGTGVVTNAVAAEISL